MRHSARKRGLLVVSEVLTPFFTLANTHDHHAASSIGHLSIGNLSLPVLSKALDEIPW